MKDRKAYLGELQNLMTKKGGNMFTGYIQKIRESAIASVPEKDRFLSIFDGNGEKHRFGKTPKS